MLGNYSNASLSDDDDDLETKGGKPSKGTPADARLKDNGKPGSGSSDDDAPAKPGKKPAFPGAAAPFGKGGKK